MMNQQQRLTSQEWQQLSTSKLRIEIRKLIREISGKEYAVIVRESPISRVGDVYVATIIGSIHPGLLQLLQAQMDRTLGFDVAIRCTGG